MFRDAARIGQIPASGASHRDGAVLAAGPVVFRSRGCDPARSRQRGSAGRDLPVAPGGRGGGGARDRGYATPPRRGSHREKCSERRERARRKRSAVSSRSQPSLSTPRDTRPRPPWRPCRDALVFRTGRRRRIRRAVHRLRGDGARDRPRSSSDPASLRVRQAVQQSGLAELSLYVAILGLLTVAF